ncbi:MAG: hypothetical protein IPP07_18640 [Holophagales bacterium]|nr:hypothetical protein [Holophagales bacterium]
MERGQPLFTLTVKGRKLVIPSPASGTFMSANARTQSDPNAVVRDPYGAGWVASIWTRDHHAAITPLRIGAAATHFLREELHRLADFMVPSGSMASVPVMADGGLPRQGALPPPSTTRPGTPSPASSSSSTKRRPRSLSLTTSPFPGPGRRKASGALPLHPQTPKSDG